MVAATHGRWIQSRYVQMSTMGKIMLTYALPPVKRTGLGRFLVRAEGKDFFLKQNGQFASFYLKKSKRADRFICRGTGRKPVQMHQCRHGTRPHWAHHHSQPGYPHEAQTHKETASRLPQSVIVVTPPRGGDSDIIRSFPNIASQTASDPMSA